MSITKTTTRIRGSLATTVSRYLLPFAASACVASLWLIVMSMVTEATASSLIVLALAVLPGAAAMVISARERKHWFEYVLVWIGFFTAVPLYGIVLLIGGYGIVLARAWRRRWPQPTQHAED
ncbi:hypothetical protein ACTXJ9_07655 [Brachybacterium tyrofermentans]|uniref:hypothetical protein n=1 Tax=Brachybacterium tyrofermentans TaxID=47848 RepID=UPI003FD41CD2